MTTNSASEAKHDGSGRDSGGATLAFPVSPDSPFPDGYDIASERDALADLMAAENPDESDPRWGRFALLCEREAQLRQMKTDYKLRQGAEHIVPDDVAREVMELGQLIDDAPDTMTLHTKEAFRAFTGRQPDAEGKVVHIAGGKRFAAVLKSIWYLSGNDNPYADWLLVMMHERLSELRRKIEGASAEKQKLIDEVKARGLSFSVMRSKNPKLVELGFRSPYGYSHERRGGAECDSARGTRASLALPRTHSMGTIPAAARDEGALAGRLFTLRGRGGQKARQGCGRLVWGNPAADLYRCDGPPAYPAPGQTFSSGASFAGTGLSYGRGRE